MGDIVDLSGAFLLDEHDVLRIEAGHWLRNLTAAAPDRDTALALFVAATTMQALATGPTPDLDRAARKLAGHLQVVLRMPVKVPDSLRRRAAGVERGPLAADPLPDRRRRRGTATGTSSPGGCSPSGGTGTCTRADVTEPEPKYFRLDRVLTAELGNERFDPPTHDEIPEWFDLSAHARTVRVRIAVGRAGEPARAAPARRHDRVRRRHGRARHHGARRPALRPAPGLPPHRRAGARPA